MKKQYHNFSLGKIRKRGDPRPMAESLISMVPLTRTRYRWNRFWKKVRHPFKKYLFRKITFIEDDKGMNKGKETITPAKKGEGGICFGPYALIENLVCGVPRSAIKTKMKGVKAKWKVEAEAFPPPHIFAHFCPDFVDEVGRIFGILQFYAGLLGLLEKRKEEEC